MPGAQTDTGTKITTLSKHVWFTDIDRDEITDSAYDYAVRINTGTAFMSKAGAATKSYVLDVSGDRPSTAAVTGDSNDAIVKIGGNNYAANDANYVLRGLNAQINQRSGGTLGRMDHNLGVQNKVGGTITTLLGLTVTAENYGTLTGTDTFGGVDVVLKNEAAVAATEFALRLRNENRSIADAVAAAVVVSSDQTENYVNTGFDYILDASGALITDSILKLADDGVAADAGSGTIGSAASGAWIRVMVGSTNFKLQLYADS